MAAADISEDDATSVGLRYVSSEAPGIRRLGRTGAFRYVHPTGDAVDDEATLARIGALVIPPAWTDVWICASANGHLQATGRDARGRRQYRYHRRFRARRDADKFDRMARFGALLPRIRRRVARDLKARGLPQEKVLAAVVRLLELTLLRVGNDEYARLNRSFGLSTVRGRHVRVRGVTVRFRFRGKGGKVNEADVSDRRLAALIRRCQDLPGQQLFQYVDEDGEARDVDSDAVNDYLRQAAGDASISAKDFRTWAATVLAYRALRAGTMSPNRDGLPSSRGTSEAATKRWIGAAMRETADRLGNTAAVARRSYVHPAVLEAAALEGAPSDFAEGSHGRAVNAAPARPADERAVLALLRGARTRR